MRAVFLGLRGLAALMVVGLTLWPSELSAGHVWGHQDFYERQRSEEQRQVLEELQRQNRRILEQQQRQFEEQQQQRRLDEINRIGEESRRNNPLNELFREMLRPPSR